MWYSQVEGEGRRHLVTFPGVTDEVLGDPEQVVEDALEELVGVSGDALDSAQSIIMGNCYDN